MLLDSEGIDAVTGEGLDDNQIFTLTVLLASVLIYNSQSVPTRRDLEGLEYPFKCSNNNEMFILTMKVFFKLQSKITSQSTICEEESRLNKDNLVNFYGGNPKWSLATRTQDHQNCTYKNLLQQNK